MMLWLSPSRLGAIGLLEFLACMQIGSDGCSCYVDRKLSAGSVFQVKAASSYLLFPILRVVEFTEQMNSLDQIGFLFRSAVADRYSRKSWPDPIAQANF
jgi:hypothetical protein